MITAAAIIGLAVLLAAFVVNIAISSLVQEQCNTRIEMRIALDRVLKAMTPKRKTK